MKLGILGVGMIVRTLLETLDRLPIERAALLCTPRSLEEARLMADRYGFGSVYTDYDQLLASQVDTVYVALPNHLHFSYAYKALRQGKNVIVEKPMAVNPRELQCLAAEAARGNQMLVEAMSVYDLPAFAALQKALPRIGKPQTMILNYSQFSSRYERFQRGDIAPVFDVTKAGGALLDLNVYNVSTAIALFGEPGNAWYTPRLDRGVDVSGVMGLDYDEFQVLCIGAKDRSPAFPSSLHGRRGSILLHSPINLLESFELRDETGAWETVNAPMKEHRLYYEFAEFVRRFAAQDTRWAEERLRVTAAVTRWMTAARTRAGLVFPNDREDEARQE